MVSDPIYYLLIYYKIVLTMFYIKQEAAIKLFASLLAMLLLVACVPKGASREICFNADSAVGKLRVATLRKTVESFGLVSRTLPTAPSYLVHLYSHQLPGSSGKCELESGFYCQQVAFLKKDGVPMQIVISEIANSADLSVSGEAIVATINDGLGELRTACK